MENDQTRVAQVREETIAHVTEAIRLCSIERGQPIHPGIARHVAVAAIIALTRGLK